MSNIAVIMKTHIWSEHLEKFSIKILEETKENCIDFYILMHDENSNLVSKVKNENLKKSIITFNEGIIKEIYPTGFFSLWLSNHWILMWFYQHYGKKYQYLWSMEYDVRIAGDSRKIWLCDRSEDFLYVGGNCIRPNNPNRKYYTGNKLEENQKYQGFLQLSRYSSKFLQHLDNCFTDGENGQDELIIFSLARRDGFTYSNHPLSRLVKGVWTWEDKYVFRNRVEYNRLEKKNSLAILHPIK